MQTAKNLNQRAEKVIERQIELKDSNRKSIIARLLSSIKAFKTKLYNPAINDTKSERSEIKNFNRNFNARRSELNANVRMYTFLR